MKLRKEYGYFILLIAAIFSCGCGLATTSNSRIPVTSTTQNSATLPEVNEIPTDQNIYAKSNHLKLSEKKQTSLITCIDGQSPISYGGISFVCNSTIGSRIEVADFSEYPLEDEYEKGDFVHPSYTSFKFSGGLSYQGKTFASKSEINVYPIEDYRRMYSVAESRIQDFDERGESLKKILFDKPAEFKERIPFIIPDDGCQAVRSQIKYISFKNGKGIAFVTQITTETELINNQRLTWVFQGITNDEKYYIYALFPITAPFLPDDKEVNKFEGYSVPIDFWAAGKHERYQKQYEHYLSSIEKRLNKLEPNQYQPSLSILSDLISSFEVR